MIIRHHDSQSDGRCGYVELINPPTGKKKKVRWSHGSEIDSQRKAWDHAERLLIRELNEG